MFYPNLMPYLSHFQFRVFQNNDPENNKENSQNPSNKGKIVNLKYAKK